MNSGILAVRVGFEPTEPVKVQRFSRPPDSTTLAPHRMKSDECFLIIAIPPCASALEAEAHGEVDSAIDARSAAAAADAGAVAGRAAGGLAELRRVQVADVSARIVVIQRVVEVRREGHAVPTVGRCPTAAAATTASAAHPHTASATARATAASTAATWAAATESATAATTASAAHIASAHAALITAGATRAGRRDRVIAAAALGAQTDGLADADV